VFLFTWSSWRGRVALSQPEGARRLDGFPVCGRGGCQGVHLAAFAGGGLSVLQVNPLDNRSITQVAARWRASQQGKQLARVNEKAFFFFVHPLFYCLNSLSGVK
jgi:hypothetical protein